MLHLLIVNGWSANAGFWAEFSDRVAGEYSVQVIDLDLNITLEQYLTIIDNHIQNNTVLMGWSLGGILVTRYSAMTKRRFLGVLTLQSNPCFLVQADWPHGMNKDAFETLKKLVSEPDLSSLVKRFTHLSVSGNVQHKQDRLKLRAIYSIENLPSIVVLENGLSMLETLDVRAVLKDISMPCCHIFSESDALVPSAVVDDIKLLVPNHGIEVIKGAGHYTQGVYLAALISILDSFVSSVVSGGRNEC